MSLLQLLSWIAVAMLGAISHELAHYAVWWLAGREPELHLWQLHVTPRAGPASVTAIDRVSAAAPYLIGASAGAVGFYAGEVLLIIFGVAMVQLPSRADVLAMCGRVRWASRE